MSARDLALTGADAVPRTRALGGAAAAGRPELADPLLEAWLVERGAL